VPVGKTLAAKMLFLEGMALNHGAHSTI